MGRTMLEVMVVAPALWRLWFLLSPMKLLTLQKWRIGPIKTVFGAKAAAPTTRSFREQLKPGGLPVSGCSASEPQRIIDALSEGKLVVAIMAKGHFTSSGHFIVLRGVQDGKIMVADSGSYKRSNQLWDLSIILNEASRRAAAGGPFWIIG